MNTLMTIMLEAQGQSSTSFWIMMILIFVVMWLFMIRPQQKKQKELEEQRKKMKAGDHVVTSGGIHGKIDRVQEDTIMVEVAKGIIIKFDKSAVFADATQPKDEKAEKAEKAAEQTSEATPEQAAAAEEEQKAAAKKRIIFGVILFVALFIGMWLGGMLDKIGLKSPILKQQVEEVAAPAEEVAEDVLPADTTAVCATDSLPE